MLPVRGSRPCHVLLMLGVSALAFLSFSRGVRGADEAPASTAAFKKYCFQCHGNAAATAGINLEQLTAPPDFGSGFTSWQKVAAALEQSHMPPKGLPQPSDGERQHLVAWIRGGLDAHVRKTAGDPGRVTVRRLTS